MTAGNPVLIANGLPKYITSNGYGRFNGTIMYGNTTYSTQFYIDAGGSLYINPPASGSFGWVCNITYLCQ